VWLSGKSRTQLLHDECPDMGQKRTGGMMFRNRTTQPETIAAEPDEDQAPGPETVPPDLAAAASRHRHHAAQTRERSSQSRAAAQDLVTAAREDAARIIAEAEAQAKLPWSSPLMRVTPRPLRASSAR
jgi:hypothetical protein